MKSGPFSRVRPILPRALLKFVIADDHLVVRQGVEALLASETGLQCVGTACSGDQVMPLLEAEQPDVLLIDLVMPGRPTGTAARVLPPFSRNGAYRAEHAHAAADD